MEAAGDNAPAPTVVAVAGGADGGAGDGQLQRVAAVTIPAAAGAAPPPPRLASPAEQARWELQRLQSQTGGPPQDPRAVLLAERERHIEHALRRRAAPAAVGGGGCGGGSGSEVALQNGAAAAAGEALRRRQQMLRLLPLQRQVRAQMVATIKEQHGDEAIEQANAHKGDKKFMRGVSTRIKHQRDQRRQEARAEKKRAADLLDAICQHSSNFKAFHRSNNHRTLRGVHQAVAKWHEGVVKKDDQRQERERRERLRALKANDEETYLKLVKDSKNERIQHLLAKTGDCLKQLGTQLQEEKHEAATFNIAQGAGAGAAGGAAIPMEAEAAADAPNEGTSKEYYQIAHSNKLPPIEAQPKMLVGGELKEYQLDGLRWLASLYGNHLNGILADEMGLGKTIQTIALFTYLIEVQQNTGPYLVVVPLSVLSNWVLELDKWAPSLKYVVFKGSAKMRKQIQQDHLAAGTFNLVLTTYEYIIKGKNVLKKFDWQYICIDEGHRIKNVESKLAQVLAGSYRSRHRLLLTGTPLQNNLGELWALLNFILPTVFSSSESFASWFNSPFADAGFDADESAGVAPDEEESLLIINRLHSVLRPFMMRRLKSEVESQLPDKVEMVLKCELSGWQKVAYKQLRMSGLGLVQADGSKKDVNNVMMQLRKCCNHPWLFEGPREITHHNPENIWRISGKFELLDRILPKMLATGHKVLIFNQMTRIIDIMQEWLYARGWHYLRLDGQTRAEDRASLVAKFKEPDSPYWIFLLTTRAGGLGLNLQNADTVIIFDSDWNPQMDLQAQDRAHRIGQTNEVRIIRLATISAIENQVLQRAREKLAMDERCIQAGMFDQKTNVSESDRQANLRQLLASEAGEEEDSDVEEQEAPSNEECNRMICRSEEEFEIFERMDREREEERAQQHRESGAPGDTLPRLFTELEVPANIRDAKVDLPKDPAKSGITEQPRQRTAVQYDDGMTESQWLRSLEEESGGSRKRRRPADALPAAAAAPANAAAAAGSGAKKRKQPAALNAMEQSLFAIWTSVSTCTAPDGRLRAELFLDKPSTHNYPDYYQLIKQVIALKDIKKRLHAHKYSTPAQFEADFRLMFANCRIYNAEGSLVLEDAVAMEAVLAEGLGALAQPNVTL